MNVPVHPGGTILPGAHDTQRRGNHALDNFRNFARAMAIGNGHFLHVGWFHPLRVAPGCHCSGNQAGSRPKSCLIKEAAT